MDEHPFKSARLLYRAIEDTPEDETFIHSLNLDPFGYAMASPRLLKPYSKKSSVEGFKKHLAEECLLGVIICLQPDANATSTTDATPTPIGQINLNAIPSIYAHHRESTIGIGILPDYQGKGYGSEAIIWATDWAFRIAGLHRLSIKAFAYNERACKLYPKLGFVQEGRLRSVIWFNGKFHDGMLFAMLEDEWREKQRQLKEKTGAA